MQWNETLQTRFNELRQRELAGTLDETEKDELAKLYAIIDADEEIYLGGAIKQMEKTAATAQKQIGATQKDNANLVQCKLSNLRFLSFRGAAVRDEESPVCQIEIPHQKAGSE